MAEEKSKGTFGHEADELARRLFEAMRGALLSITPQVRDLPHTKEAALRSVDELGFAIERAMAAMVLGHGVILEQDEGPKVEKEYAVQFYTIEADEDRGIVDGPPQEMIIGGESPEQVLEAFAKAFPDSLSRKNIVSEIREVGNS